MQNEHMGRVVSPTADHATANVPAGQLAVVRAEGRRVTDVDRQAAQQKAAYNRLRTMDRDVAYKAPDNKHNINAAREYRRQLSRTLGKSDRKAAAKAFAGKSPQAIAADKAIAKKMFIAGYSPQQIQRAMKCGSPACARMSGAKFNAYYRKHIQPSIRNRKTQQQRQKMAMFKQRRGLPQSYTRMDGLRGHQQQHKALQQAPPRMRPDPMPKQTAAPSQAKQPSYSRRR